VVGSNEISVNVPLKPFEFISFIDLVVHSHFEVLPHSFYDQLLQLVGVIFNAHQK
jgi:hypothetical protein